jgi:hypothetical protein
VRLDWFPFLPRLSPRSSRLGTDWDKHSRVRSAMPTSQDPHHSIAVDSSPSSSDIKTTSTSSAMRVSGLRERDTHEYELAETGQDGSGKDKREREAKVLNGLAEGSAGEGAPLTLRDRKALALLVALCTLCRTRSSLLSRLLTFPSLSTTSTPLSSLSPLVRVLFALLDAGLHRQTSSKVSPSVSPSDPSLSSSARNSPTRKSVFSVSAPTPTPSNSSGRLLSTRSFRRSWDEGRAGSFLSRRSSG